MESPAPEGFCGVGRRKAQPVSAIRASLSTSPRRKSPRPFGLRSGGRPRRRRARPYFRYALRAAPGGSPRRNATQAASISENQAPATELSSKAPPIGSTAQKWAPARAPILLGPHFLLQQGRQSLTKPA